MSGNLDVCDGCVTSRRIARISETASFYFFNLCAWIDNYKIVGRGLMHNYLVVRIISSVAKIPYQEYVP